jgi:hypothetical protein
VQRRLLDGFAGRFKPGDAQLSALQFIALAPLRFERLRRGDAGRLATPFPAAAPLDEVQTFSQGVSVIVAFGVAGMESSFQSPSTLIFLTMLTWEWLDEIGQRHELHHGTSNPTRRPLRFAARPEPPGSPAR